MAPTSNATTGDQLDNDHKIEQQWKRNMWNQQTATQLLYSDDRMIRLKSEDKNGPKVCSVHRALLCLYLPYNDKLLNGGFAEGLVPRIDPLTLETGANILKLFVAWLYTGQIIIAPAQPRWYRTITKLYILAGELNCVALQRSIISAQPTNSDHKDLPSFETIGLLMNSSLETSGLYHFYVETYAAHWNGEIDGSLETPDMEHIVPHKLAYHLLCRTAQVAHNVDYRCACCHDTCKFHGHESEAERKATCGGSYAWLEGNQEELFDSHSDSDSESEL
ncbi:hypothetical protein QM012_008528 [Aureobasidium pullulans]|uniref:BTB domain-containing protein n=1 Tax=Aureobasidium pullulans TaxID=5580 RepID=A0ABR0TJN4_AURPU